MVRALQPGDRDTWEELWQAYLVFYKASQSHEVTSLTWQRLTDPAEAMYGMVAISDDTIVGIVHFLYHRSTWTAGPYCYLQDLFTAEASRGQGVATLLVDAVSERAKTDRASRVYWLTQESNTTARSLYDRIATKSGFLHYLRTL